MQSCRSRRSGRSSTGCAASERARAKLLLVDDRPENLLALEALLEPLGQELVRAESGEEALRHLLQEEFAAILLDVQMPGLDGFQTAELIKQRERTRHVPIIFLTAISKDAEHIFRGYDAGAVDYLMKPFEPHILRAKVAVFIDLWQKTVEIRRQDALLKEQEISALERESEERYTSLADAVPQIVWTTDADGRVVFYNERWFEYTGMTRGAEVHARTVVHPDDIPAMEERWKLSQATGEPFEIEYRFRRADGSYRWHLGRAVCQKDDKRQRDRLGRVGDRHRGPQARRGPADLPRRGGLGARQLARLRADAHRRRAARGAADRRLVRRRHLRRRPARAPRARARRPAQDGSRAGAAGGDARGVRGRRRDSDPHADAGARP